MTARYFFKQHYLTKSHYPGAILKYWQVNTDLFSAKYNIGLKEKLITH